jgi:transcriptional regulator with XRE-family HTH domain
MSKVREPQLAETLKDLGSQIRDLRHETGLPQDKFGEKCGWDRTRQSQIESGRYNLTIRTLLSMGNALKRKLSINFKD